MRKTNVELIRIIDQNIIYKKGQGSQTFFYASLSFEEDQSVAFVFISLILLHTLRSCFENLEYTLRKVYPPSFFLHIFLHMITISNGFNPYICIMKTLQIGHNRKI